MRSLGTIVRLQIQRASLKTGERPYRVYDPDPLMAVTRLALGPDGALGADPASGAAGAWIVDVHHRAHPRTRNEDGEHGISVGFTAHYQAMRARFGEHLVEGSAGENLIAATEGRVHSADVARGLAIFAPGGAERVRLRVLEAAQPCRPFTGWALGRMVDPPALKESLQFLEDGMRGYYCVAEGSGIVEVGDELAAL
jgi:hypothetical protein